MSHGNPSQTSLSTRDGTSGESSRSSVRVEIEDEIGETGATIRQPRRLHCPCLPCFKNKRKHKHGPPKKEVFPYGEDKYAPPLEPADQSKFDRKWKHFTGNNRFYCRGRVMTAPSIRYFLVCCSLILLTFTLFMVFDVPFLITHFTIAIPIVASTLIVIVIVNMLRTTCSDPGILPRASRDETEYVERSYGNLAASRPPPRTKDIIVNGQVVKSKYCFTCKMFRPPRASHCSICDNCVERFDHHCPWIGNCIGRRNYRSFYFFVVFLSLLAIFILSLSVTHLVMLSKERGNFLAALRESPISAVVILISFLGMWTVLGLAGFHSYLICVEQTTNEDIKGLFGKPNSNPYSRGNAVRNCCFLLCGPVPPSLIDPRGRATDDFLQGLPKPPLEHAEMRVGSALGSYGSHCAADNSSTGTGPANGRNGNGVPVGGQPLQVNSRSQGPSLSRIPGNHAPHNGGALYPVTINTASSPPNHHGASSNIPQKSGTFPDSTRTFVVPRLSSPRSEARSNTNSTYYSASTSMEMLVTSTESKRSSAVQNSVLRPGRSSDGGESALEDLTMINSPLHLDSIM